jgi:hypothetical protein
MLESNEPKSKTTHWKPSPRTILHDPEKKSKIFSSNGQHGDIVIKRKGAENLFVPDRTAIDIRPNSSRIYYRKVRLHCFSNRVGNGVPQWSLLAAILPKWEVRVSYQ